MWALYWVYGSCFRKDLVSIVVSQSILSIKWSFFFGLSKLEFVSLGFILFLLPSFNLCSTVRIVFAYFYFSCNLSTDWILCNRMETLCDWKDGLYFTFWRWNLKPKCSTSLMLVHTPSACSSSFTDQDTWKLNRQAGFTSVRLLQAGSSCPGLNLHVLPFISFQIRERSQPPACLAAVQSPSNLALNHHSVPWPLSVGLLEQGRLASAPWTVDLVRLRLQTGQQPENQLAECMRDTKYGTAFFWLSLAILRSHHVILDRIKWLEKKNEHRTLFYSSSLFLWW